MPGETADRELRDWLMSLGWHAERADDLLAAWRSEARLRGLDPDDPGYSTRARECLARIKRPSQAEASDAD